MKRSREIMHNWVVAIVGGMIVTIGGGLILHKIITGDFNTYSKIDSNTVKSFVQKYNKCTIENNFSELRELYAPSVIRYHNAYDKSREYVIECYEKYDKKYGVYGKHSDIRWNTLQIDKKPNGLIGVQYIQDYSINSDNPKIYKKFVIEKHIMLDKNCQIVSIYDNQISRSK